MDYAEFLEAFFMLRSLRAMDESPESWLEHQLPLFREAGDNALPFALAAKLAELAADGGEEVLWSMDDEMGQLGQPDHYLVHVEVRWLAEECGIKLCAVLRDKGLNAWLSMSNYLDSTVISFYYPGDNLASATSDATDLVAEALEEVPVAA